MLTFGGVARNVGVKSLFSRDFEGENTHMGVFGKLVVKQLQVGQFIHV